MARYRRKLSITLEAPVAKVWEAWTTAEGWDRWFTSGAQIDLRVGGSYTNADQDSGEYLEIVKHKLLRFTWNNPHHQPGSVVTLRFSALGKNKCRLVLTHSRLALESESIDLKAGWSWALASLRSYLATGRGIKEAEWKGK